jgi:hypothetical protein
MITSIKPILPSVKFQKNAQVLRALNFRFSQTIGLSLNDDIQAISTFPRQHRLCDDHTSQTWQPNLPSRRSALSRSSLTSSLTARSRPSQAELERVAEDGTRTLDWVSAHQRTRLRATTSVRLFWNRQASIFEGNWWSRRLMP